MQIKPFYVGFRKGQRVYGLREQGAITCLDPRPWYGGKYWINGRNTDFMWDHSGLYMSRVIRPRLRVRSIKI